MADLRQAAQQALEACPFCGDEPSFSGSASDWKDESRYVELSLGCCVSMTEQIGWRRARDMTHEAKTAELQNRLRLKWNTRAALEQPEQEPVACLVRNRSVRTPARIAADGIDRMGDWSEWKEAALSYGLAVTDPTRNYPQGDCQYEMRILYTHPPRREVEQPESRWCSECNEHVTTRCHGDERSCVFNWSAIRAAHVGRRSAKPEQAAALAQSEQKPVGFWDGEFSEDGGATLYEVPQISAFGYTYRNIPLYAQPPCHEWQSLTDEEIKNLPLYNNPSSEAVEYARAIEAKLKEKNT